MAKAIIANHWQRIENVSIKRISRKWKEAVVPPSLQAALDADPLATMTTLGGLQVDMDALDEPYPFAYIIKDEASDEVIVEKPLSKKHWGLTPMWKRLKAEG